MSLALGKRKHRYEKEVKSFRKRGKKKREGSVLGGTFVLSGSQNRLLQQS